MGNYKMISTIVRGKPVWKKTDRDYFIYYNGMNNIHIVIVMMYGPGSMITGYWMVHDDITDDRGWIKSEQIGLTIPPRSGLEYTVGTSWVLDDNLLFLPGGLTHALRTLDVTNDTEISDIEGG